jgi:hypothetical protein
MTIKRFTPITLPKTAVRRSWLLNRADERINLFARLLAKLDPTRTINHVHGKMSAYFALLDYLGTLFPVFESEFEIYEDEGENPVFVAIQMGIPADVRGRTYEDRFEQRTWAALSAIEWFRSSSEERRRPNSYESNLNDYPALKPIQRHLEEFRYSELVASALKPGRGREWIEPWNGLLDLVEYVDSNTGIFWLDVSHMDIDESGGSYPMWSIGEIRALAREWKKAEVVWERIKRLADYIDANPANRVWLLLAVLSGLPDAREEVTRYKPSARKPKTLAEVWNV